MATRKRVHAICRGPDGSAFQRCEECKVLVAIALADMHECQVIKSKTNVKRPKRCDFGQEKKFGNYPKEYVQEEKFQDQPRSAYCFFREEFMNACEEEKYIDVDRRAFGIWKNMTAAEKNPYKIKEKEVNSAYEKALLKEENDMIWVDDEADSSQVLKCDKNIEGYDLFDSPNWSNRWWSETSESFNIIEWSAMQAKMFGDDK